MRESSFILSLRTGRLAYTLLDERRGPCEKDSPISYRERVRSGYGTKFIATHWKLRSVILPQEKGLREGSTTPNIETVEKPILLSLDGRGFHVLRYSAIPEEEMTRLSFELVDPNSGEGASAEAVVDPKLVEDLNFYRSQGPTSKAFLIWIDTVKGEVSWQLRKIPEFGL